MSEVYSPLPTGDIYATVAAFKDETRIQTHERAERLLRVASGLVEGYASSADQSSKNEACVRIASYVDQSQPNNIRSKTSQDEFGREITVSYSPGERGALRHSGAMALLEPYHQRRAAAIG